jgi:hypothetical protein
VDDAVFGHIGRLTGANLATQVTPERLERLADLVAVGTLKRPELEAFSLESAPRALEKVRPVMSAASW